MPPATNYFKEALAAARSDGRPLILDGAVGTELDNRGADTASAAWSALAALDSPELLLAVHEDYVAAGAEIITANTFRATARAFRKAKLPDGLWREAARESVILAKKASSGKCLVAASVAPLEDCFDPSAAPGGHEAYDEHLSLMEHLSHAGADILWLETFGTLGEMEAAGRAARDIGASTGLPFTVSVTTEASGRLVSGEPIVEAVKLAASLRAAAFSINCIPVGHVKAALPFLESCPIPKGVYANLGRAEEKQDWRGSAYLSPEEYAEAASKWNVDIIGGCCGSNPAHIRRLCERLGSRRK